MAGDAGLYSGHDLFKPVFSLQRAVHIFRTEKIALRGLDDNIACRVITDVIVGSGIARRIIDPAVCVAEGGADGLRPMMLIGDLAGASSSCRSGGGCCCATLLPEKMNVPKAAIERLDVSCIAPLSASGTLTSAWVDRIYKSDKSSNRSLFELPRSDEKNTGLEHHISPWRIYRQRLVMLARHSLRKINAESGLASQAGCER